MKKGISEGEDSGKLPNFFRFQSNCKRFQIDDVFSG